MTSIIRLGDTALVPVHWYGSFLTYAWIDADDVALATSRRWHAIGRTYAACTAGLMHRLILGLTPGDRIGHHVNEDSFDNRRSNLHICADALDHGAQPHPRRNLASGGHLLPPHERELLIGRTLGAERDRARSLREAYFVPRRPARSAA